MITIRKYTEEDKEQIWKIIKSVISTGDTYVFAPDSSREKMLRFWCGAEKQTYVAVLSEPPALAGGLNLPEKNFASANKPDEKIVGSFYIKENQPDLGSHIANAGYIVSPEARGRGVGRQMAEFSLEEARRSGYKAMQFNFVVKTNEMAVKLWQNLGFEIIGEIPEAFNHLEKGLTNAYIMYRRL